MKSKMPPTGRPRITKITINSIRPSPNILSPIYNLNPLIDAASFLIIFVYSYNNDYTNLSFYGFLKEYSIVGIFLKGILLQKSRCLMKAHLAFTPYYNEMPNWYKIGNVSLFIFKSN
jgi:hypothetical protein